MKRLFLALFAMLALACGGDPELEAPEENTAADYQALMIGINPGGGCSSSCTAWDCHNILAACSITCCNGTIARCLNELCGVAHWPARCWCEGAPTLPPIGGGFIP